MFKRTLLGCLLAFPTIVFGRSITTNISCDMFIKNQKVYLISEGRFYGFSPENRSSFYSVLDHSFPKPSEFYNGYISASIAIKNGDSSLPNHFTNSNFVVRINYQKNFQYNSESERQALSIVLKEVEINSLTNAPVELNYKQYSVKCSTWDGRKDFYNNEVSAPRGNPEKVLDPEMDTLDTAHLDVPVLTGGKVIGEMRENSNGSVTIIDPAVLIDGEKKIITSFSNFGVCKLMNREFEKTSTDLNLGNQVVRPNYKNSGVTIDDEGRIYPESYIQDSALRVVTCR